MKPFKRTGAFLGQPVRCRGLPVLPHRLLPVVTLFTVGHAQTQAHAHAHARAHARAHAGTRARTHRLRVALWVAAPAMQILTSGNGVRCGAVWKTRHTQMCTDVDGPHEIMCESSS